MVWVDSWMVLPRHMHGLTRRNIALEVHIESLDLFTKNGLVLIFSHGKEAEIWIVFFFFYLSTCVVLVGV